MLLTCFLVISLNIFPIKTEDNITELIKNFESTWAVDDWKKFGFYYDDYVKEINVHWLKYSVPYDASFYTIGILYFINMVFGVCGNFLVVFLFIKCKSLRTSANTLIVNLAVSDCLMVLKSPIVIYNSFFKGPALGDIACRVYCFLAGLTGVNSIITLAVISFDRYFVIKYPLNRTFSDVRVKICLVVAWLYGAIFASIPALDIGFGKYTYEGYLTSCSFDYLSDDPMTTNFIVVFFCAAWVVPFILILFSYMNIMKVVINRSRSQKKGRDSFRHVKEEDNKKQEIKLALIVLSTIVLWFLSWTPYAVIALVAIGGKKDFVHPLVSMLPALFCKTAACINPYVYALSHPKFKAELRKICCKCITNNTDKNNKVYTTETKPETKTENFLSKEEDSTSTLTSEEHVERFVEDKPGKNLKRQGTVVEMICLRPNFSNKTSSFRKLARRWSSKERNRGADVDDDDGNDNGNKNVSIVSVPIG